MAAPRPKYPPLFLEEIFMSRRYRQDFRRFLVKHDVVEPLQFLEMASWLRFYKEGSDKQLAHANKMHKKFFGKEANFGKKLLCDDKTIHLIAVSESVCPTFVFAAFLPVYRSMEKNWFRKYLQTFRGKAPSIRTMEVSPIEVETDKTTRGSTHRTDSAESITPSKRVLRKLAQFIVKMQSTSVHRQMIDYVRILYEEEMEQMRAVLRPRFKGGKKETEKFEETISGLKRGDLPNLEKRILFLHDIIQYKTLYNCLNQYGGVYNEKPSLVKKASLIVKKYLNSDSKPDLLLGVPQRLTVEAKMCFKRIGPCRTLFHELTLSLLPMVYKIWKAMWIECTRCGGKAAFALVIKQKQDHYSSEESMNVLNNMKKEAVVSTNEREVHGQLITLSFSLQKGIRVFVPKQNKEDKTANRHLSTRQSMWIDSESMTDVRGGSRLGYVLIK